MTTFWDKFYNRPLEKIPWHQTQADWFVELIEGGEVKGETALDVGCGVGAKSVYLAQHGFGEVTGVDIAPKAIEHANKNATDAGVGDICTFYTGDASDLSFLPENKQFDLVLDWATLHCISDEEQASYISNVSKRVKPEGLLLLRVFTSDDNRDNFTEEIEGEVETIHLFNEEKITVLYKDFEVIARNTSQPKTKTDIYFLELLLKRT